MSSSWCIVPVPAGGTDVATLPCAHAYRTMCPVQNFARENCRNVTGHVDDEDDEEDDDDEIAYFED